MNHKRNQLVDLNNAGAYRIPVSRVEGRTFISNGQRFYDFCSCNYLGYEFDPHVHATAQAYAENWGVLSGWSRMEADSQVYLDLEQRICDWLAAPKTLLGMSVTMNGFSIMPGIAKKGVILADSLLHTVVWEAARLARDHGAELVKFRHQDMADLERLLEAHADRSPKIVAVDGVYSISTVHAPIRALQALCEKYDAWLYVDDAHGFGILGEAPSAANPYGKGGKGVVAHAGGDYSRTFYVTSFGKAFCAQNAFTVIPSAYEEDVRAM
ncbi:MAG TPA: aminotransferase class I/II-fold pyridoxal phosphate-dependent enzyme, partial [Myxococcota bacterium]|nr:aminotransferase class I/II-fold pyridoxal phosphate-dependent enzyme [Myxococcota bacterium]